MHIATKIRLLEFSTVWRLALVALAIVLFGALAVFPYIPTSGDTFSCWYNYIANWRIGGLALSLKRADATGRYPGYPLYLLLIENTFRVNFLTALLVLRVICLSGTFLAIFSFFRSVGLTLVAAIIFSATILLTPTCWVNIQLNSQDSTKILFFVLAIMFLKKFMGGAGNERWTWYVMAILSSINLVCVRAPEGFPFYAFAFLYLFSQKQSWQKRLLSFILVSAPSAIFVFALHIYGKTITGHFALSGPNVPPEIWLKMAIAYLHSLKASGLVKALEFIRLSATVFLNKGSYFVEDYLFFNAHSVRILDYGRFYTELRRVSPWRALIYYPTLATLTIGCIYLLFLNVASKYAKPLILAGLVSAGFYTFGLNHYEPRYWLFVFVAPAMGLVCIFGNRKKFLIGAVAVLLFLQIPRSSLQLYRYWVIDSKTKALAAKWQARARIMCKNGVRYVLIPVNDYEFTSYRYFASQACPSLKFLIAESANLTESELKQSVKLTPDDFNGIYIIGLDKNKLTF